MVEHELTQGEMLRVHPGHVGLFESTVNVDLTTIPGIKNKLFGGDGLFLAQLTGTGKVWLQSISLAALAHALQPYIASESVGEGAAAVGTAAVLGSLIKNA